MQESIRHIDTLFADLAQKIPYGTINPQDYSKIQNKFLKTKTLPKVTYSCSDCDFVFITDALKAITIPTSPYADILKQKKQELLDKNDMLASIGTDNFSSSKVYAKPNKALVNKAYSVLEEVPSQKNTSVKITRRETRKMLRQALQQIGFSWKIVNEDMTTSARVSAHHKLIRLRAKERFRKAFVQRLVVHEVGTHAARAENGALQPLKMFELGLANYLDTEEGLAVYNEERSGILDNNTLRNYAGRVVAVHLAQHNGFSDTFKELSKHFTDKQAFKLTMRAKRGLGNPEQDGAFLRDATYLRGYYEVKKFAQHHWIHDLMLGKIGTQHIDMCKRMPGIRPARYLADDVFDLV